MAIFRGLKQQIVLTIVGLVTLGMVMVSIVIVIFWQRDMIRAEVEHVQTVLRQWRDVTTARTGVKLQQPVMADLEKICLAAQGLCKNVFFYDGNTIIALHGAADSEFRRDLRATSLAGAGMVRFSGMSWGIYSPGWSSLFVSIPLSETGKDGGSLAMVVDLQPIHDRIRQQQGIIVSYIVVNVLILGIVGFFRLLKLVIRPVEKLVSITESYKDAEMLSFSFESEGNEFGKLSSALNRMMSRIESDRKKLRASVASLEQANDRLITSQKEMVRAEKLAAVGRLSAGLAHEIGNPLGIIQGYLELLEQDDLQREEKQQFCERSIKELNRINKLVRQLLNLTRSPVAEKCETRIYSVLSDVMEIIKTQKDMNSIEISLECIDKSIVAVINGADLHQVVLNCVLNSIDAIKSKGDNVEGKIALSCGIVREEGQPEKALIRVQDDGAGVKKEWLENIFDPFFTTKEVGKGTGLGLSVSRAIIASAGGKIWAESETGEGLTVKIELPIIMEAIDPS